MKTTRTLARTQQKFLNFYHDLHVAAQFIRMLANKLSGKEDELVRLAYNFVRKHVADALLLLVYGRYKNSEKNDKKITIVNEEKLKRMLN